MAFGAVSWMHHMYQGAPIVFGVGVIGVLYTAASWWGDVIREAEHRGDHTRVVQISHRYGMILFIASEVMFFVAWFWAFFNSALFPADPVHATREALFGGVWPPKGIETFDPWHLPFLNTLILLLNIVAIRALVRTPPAQASAGIAAGLATAIKPYAALTVAYLLVKRQWRAFGLAIATLVLAQAVPLLTYGVSGTLSELRLWRTTLSASTPVLLTNSDAISVLAFCTKWLGDPALASMVALALLGVLALVFFAVILRGRNEPDAAVLEGAMLLTLTPLVSPLGWDYNFLMALPAIMLLVGHRSAFPTAARVVLMANLAMIALVLYDTLGRQAYAAFMQYSITTLNFIIVVVALAYLRFTRVR